MSRIVIGMNVIMWLVIAVLVFFALNVPLAHDGMAIDSHGNYDAAATRTSAEEQRQAEFDDGVAYSVKITLAASAASVASAYGIYLRRRHSASRQTRSSIHAQ